MPGPPDPATTEWVPIWTPMNTGPVGPTGPQGTPGENWFAGAGVPAGSLATSIVGDWYLDTTTGDVYEKTGASTWTLRANIKGPQGVQGVQGPQGPTGATGPSGSTASHHVNHEPGGSDYLVNSVWTDKRNTFTKSGYAAIDVEADLPLIQWAEMAAPVNTRKWQLYAGNQKLVFQTTDDGETVAQSTPLFMDRSGNVTAGGGLNAGSATGNVACKNQANVFTQPQSITSNGLARIKFTDTAQPADLRVFDIINSSQGLYLRAVNDADTVVGGNAVLTRNGDFVLSRDMYEKARSVPIGHWQDVPFSAGNFQGYSGSIWTVTAPTINHFSLVGKTMSWNVVVSGAMSGTPQPYLLFVIPGGCTARKANDGLMNTYAVDSDGYIQVVSAVWVDGSQYILCTKTVGNFGGTVTISLAMRFEIL